MLHHQQNLETIISELKSKGYNVATAEDSVLIAWDIPYINSTGTIRRGILAFPIVKENNDWIPAVDHTAYFKGEIPCNSKKEQLSWIIDTNTQWNIAGGVGIAKIRMSCKKTHSEGTISTYGSIEDKLVNYIRIIEAYAKRIDPSISAQTYNDPPDIHPVGPFLYPDSASSRNGIGNLNERFATKKIGIIGLGGTGSYLLDIIAKTHVQEIHLYDSDIFDAHNSFRAPGASSIDEINQNEPKVTRYARIYSKFRNGIIPHMQKISTENNADIQFLDFVFLSVDNDLARHDIISMLEENNTPYIDVGMFAQLSGQNKNGICSRIRTTLWYTGLPRNSGHYLSCDNMKDDDYKSNIQIAELNALNASLAVIKWKKYMGYYLDHEKETMSTYDSYKNSLVNRKKKIVMRTKLVKYIPEEMQNGVLYISQQYQTASHLCPCGCNSKIVTPLGKGRWKLTLLFGIATLKPSIGNGSLPCHSHYWITNNKVVWSYPL